MTNAAITHKNPITAKVSSIIDEKTAKVDVERIVQHALYHKRLRRTTTLLVDITNKTVQVGETVRILPCRKISAKKAWRVV